MTASDYEAFEQVVACPLCGSHQQESVDSDAAVVRCQGCGHRYVDPRPTQAEIARGYSRPDAYDDWLQIVDAREALWQRRFDRALGDTRPGRLLDIGAGMGTFLAMARDHGWAVEGIEISTTGIAHAKEQYGLTIRHGFLEEAAPPGPYDVISLWHVIEHIPDPPATLRFCRGMLADEGRIVLAMPNDGNLAWSLTATTNVARRLFRRPPSIRYQPLRPGIESHIQHFNQDSIKRLLVASGFMVDRITVDDAAPTRSRKGWAAFRARRLLTRVTPWNFGREMLVLGTRGPEAD